MNNNSLNKRCFVRIYQSTDDPALPMTYIRELGMTSPALIFVPDEIYFLYVNSNLPIDNVSLSDGSSNHVLNPTITPVAYTGGEHFIIDLTFPDDIPDGVYLMKLYIDATAYDSVFVEVINSVAEANEVSAFFRISHNKILGDFYYPYAGESFKQRMRLRSTMKDQQTEINTKVYEASNTGKRRNLQGTIIDYVLIETPDYCLEDHQAAMLLSVHDNIIINEVEYTRRPDNSYKSNMVLDIPLSTGEFGLFNNDSTIQLRC